MKKYCYFNGKIIEENKAHINLNDIGILRAYACFDFLQTYNGKLFLFDEHWRHFKNSSKNLCLNIPLSKQDLKKNIQKLLIKNKLKEASIRIILTGGKTPDSISFNKNTPTFFILVNKAHHHPLFLYKKGTNLITHEFQRQNYETKTINYIESIKLNNLYKNKKIHDILYFSDSNVLETPSGNFFIIKDNKLITPKENVFLGTTRNLVIKLAKKYYKVEERNIPVKELKSADEAFITSTSRAIMPIVKIDNFKISQGKVGSKTKLLMKIFKEFTENY